MIVQSDVARFYYLIDIFSQMSNSKAESSPGRTNALWSNSLDLGFFGLSDIFLNSAVEAVGRLDVDILADTVPSTEPQSFSDENTTVSSGECKLCAEESDDSMQQQEDYAHPNELFSQDGSDIAAHITSPEYYAPHHQDLVGDKDSSSAVSDQEFLALLNSMTSLLTTSEASADYEDEDKAFAEEVLLHEQDGHLGTLHQQAEFVTAHSSLQQQQQSSYTTTPATSRATSPLSSPPPAHTPSSHKNASTADDMKAYAWERPFRSFLVSSTVCMLFNGAHH